MKTKEFVCADCGTFCNRDELQCPNCHGRRIAAVFVIENLLGPDWWKKSFGGEHTVEKEE